MERKNNISNPNEVFESRVDLKDLYGSALTDSIANGEIEPDEVDKIALCLADLFTHPQAN